MSVPATTSAHGASLLAFPRAAGGQPIDVPSTAIHPFFTHIGLGKLAVVCKSWHKFVNDVAQRKMRLAIEEGLKLDPARVSPMRFLQIAIGSDRELQTRITQIIPCLTCSGKTNFIFYGPDGRGHLRAVNAVPNAVPINALTFDPESNDLGNTQYLLTYSPDPAAIKTTWYPQWLVFDFAKKI